MCTFIMLISFGRLPLSSMFYYSVPWSTSLGKIRKWCFWFCAWNFFNSLSPGCAHWGRMTHICVSKLTIIGSDNDLSPSRRQAIIWTNAGILLIRPSGTNFSETLIEIDVFSFKKMQLKVSSAKRRTFCLGLNVLNMARRLSRCANKKCTWCHSKSFNTTLWQYNKSIYN